MNLTFELSMYAGRDTVVMLQLRVFHWRLFYHRYETARTVQVGPLSLEVWW